MGREKSNMATLKNKMAAIYTFFLPKIAVYDDSSASAKHVL